MIVVTGTARTGTSLMMQTLVLLGCKTPAKKFVDEHKDIMDKNPKGFYELTDEIYGGINNDRYKGQAVKIFPGTLHETDKKLISKMIVCKRNRRDAIKSYEPIHKILKQEYTPEFLYDANYFILDNYISDIKHIFINFEDITSNPSGAVLRICEFLEISPSPENINEAIKNIDYANDDRSRSGRSNISLRDVPRIRAEESR